MLIRTSLTAEGQHLQGDVHSCTFFFLGWYRHFSLGIVFLSCFLILPLFYPSRLTLLDSYQETPNCKEKSHSPPCALDFRSLIIGRYWNWRKDQVFATAWSTYNCKNNSSCLDYFQALAKVITTSCQKLAKSAHKSTLPTVLCFSKLLSIVPLERRVAAGL